MRMILRLICLACLCAANVGCLLDEIRRDDGRLHKFGASAKARAIEDSVDWGPSL
jgi:hypothetical protein